MGLISLSLANGARDAWDGESLASPILNFAEINLPCGQRQVPFLLCLSIYKIKVLG